MFMLHKLLLQEIYFSLVFLFFYSLFYMIWLKFIATYFITSLKINFVLKYLFELPPYFINNLSTYIFQLSAFLLLYSVGAESYFNNGQEAIIDKKNLK